VIIPPVGGLAGELSLAQSSLAQGAQGAQGAQSAAEALPSGGTEAAGEGGFSSELSEAIGSLEKTQQSADSASQALATGTVKDPESAVVTVEDAQLAMQLAAQIRTKATEAAQTIFQTQV
jgi:flagellar hook-basal body complex protein FliE